MKSKKLTALLLVLCAALVCFSGCGGGAQNNRESSGSGGADAEEPAKKEPVELSILCVGDVMAHYPNLYAAVNDSTGEYEFDENYVYVKGYIEGADLAICNLEGAIADGEASGYPLFNYPESLAKTLADTGFDVAINANNHMMDQGYDGLVSTVEVLRKNGLKTAGSKLEGEDNANCVIDVKGVKVGIVAYTYETTGSAGERPSINGNYVSDEAAEQINSFNYYELSSSDYARIQADVDKVRADGAQIVIAYMHWGEEYQRTPNTWQTQMAQKLVDMGVDIIYASHPHVPQEIAVLTSGSGKNVPVFYSLGNFISNQRLETVDDRYTEEGVLGFVKLKFDTESNTITSEFVRGLPTWVDKYSVSTTQYGWKYAIVPLEGRVTEIMNEIGSGHLAKAQQAYEDAVKLFGDYVTGVSVDPYGRAEPDLSENEGTGASTTNPSENTGNGASATNPSGNTGNGASASAPKDSGASGNNESDKGASEPGSGETPEKAENSDSISDNTVHSRARGADYDSGGKNNAA